MDMAVSDKQRKKDQMKWEAEDDARSLAKAMMIRKDSKRMARAKEGAKRVLNRDKQMMMDQQDMLKAMKAIAKDKNFFDYDSNDDKMD